MKLLKSIFNLIFGWLLVCFVTLVLFAVNLAWFSFTAFSNRCFIASEPAIIDLKWTGYFGPIASSFWNASSCWRRENVVAVLNADDSSKSSRRRGRQIDNNWRPAIEIEIIFLNASNSYSIKTKNKSKLQVTQSDSSLHAKHNKNMHCNISSKITLLLAKDE